MAFGIDIASGDVNFGLQEPAGANLLVDGAENNLSSLTLDANETLAIAQVKELQL